MRSKLLHLLRRQHLDLQVEQLQHPQVLRPAHAEQAADDGRLTRAAQQIAQRQAAGDRVRVRIVVQHDQHAIRVREIPLILLDLLAGHRASQLDEERWTGQFGKRQAGDFREGLPQVVGALRVLGRRAQHPHQRAAGGAHGLQDAAQRSPPVVLDDDAGARREIRADEGVDTFRVADDDAEVCFVEAPGQRRAFDEHVELAAGREHGIEQPHDQLRVTDREAPHRARASRPASGVLMTDDLRLYARPSKVSASLWRSSRPKFRLPAGSQLL